MKTKEVKRKEAHERNTHWANTPHHLKLDILASRPGESRKQINRINTEALNAA